MSASTAAQSIVTYYRGPVNGRPARVKATASSGSVTVNYDHTISDDDNHRVAADALADQLGWPGRMSQCTLPGPTAGVFVFHPI